jgi:hypothetical protein
MLRPNFETTITATAAAAAVAARDSSNATLQEMVMQTLQSG